MDRNKFKATCLYQLNSLKLGTYILAPILLVNLIIGIILKANGVTGGSIDLITFIFAAIVGMEMLKEIFSFFLINGVSRKTYFKSVIFTFTVVAFAWSILTTVMSLLSIAFANNTIIFLTIFPNNTLAMLIWFFAIIFALATIYWFICVVLNVITKRTKFIIIGCLGVMIPIIILLDLYIGGILLALKTFAQMFFGAFNGEPPNAYLSSLVFILLSGLILAITWLFVRKMEVK